MRIAGTQPARQERLLDRASYQIVKTANGFAVFHPDLEEVSIFDCKEHALFWVSYLIGE